MARTWSMASRNAGEDAPGERTSLAAGAGVCCGAEGTVTGAGLGTDAGRGVVVAGRGVARGVERGAEVGAGAPAAPLYCMKFTVTQIRPLASTTPIPM